MLEILMFATALFAATPAMAQETAPATVAPTATTAVPATTTTATTAATPPTAPAAQPSIWQSLGNQVIAHDTITGMDKDGSNTVSHDEYMAYQETQFKVLDANSDGVLSADEVGANKKKSWTSFW